VRTVAIVPFENTTPRPEITDEVFQALLREFPRSQGLTPAEESVADAVVRGRITNYRIETPSYRRGATGDAPEVLQREVILTVEVEILNQVDDEIHWESRNLSVRGQFLPDSEDEEVGRSIAIDLLIQQIIDGVQSNW
jgi:hypothetical protein